MSKSNISKIVRGERKLAVETLLQIARILDVDPASLIPSAQIDTKKLAFEEYVREIIRGELSTEKRHT